MACVCAQLIATCESTTINPQRRTEKRSENKEKAKALEVCKEKKLTRKHQYKPPASTEVLVAIPGCFVPCWIPQEARRGSGGDPDTPVGRGEGWLPCQEQPPCHTVLLACAGTGTELGVRPDSTAPLDEESFQSGL